MRLVMTNPSVSFAGAAKVLMYVLPLKTKKQGLMENQKNFYSIKGFHIMMHYKSYFLLVTIRLGVTEGFCGMLNHQKITC